MTITTDTTPAVPEDAPTPAAEAPDVPEAVGTDDELVADDEVLIEEISIDGMCGVY